MKYAQVPVFATLCVSMFQMTGCATLPGSNETSGAVSPVQVASAEAEAYRAAGIPLADLLERGEGSQTAPTMKTSVVASNHARSVVRTQRSAKPVKMALSDKSAAPFYPPRAVDQVSASSHHDMMAGLGDYLTVMGF